MKLSASDVAVSAVVILASAFLFNQFLVSYNATSSHAGEKPIGTVVFKKMSATRKSTSGFTWERMKNNGPVFESDTLRTADFSEAEVRFEDGANLNIFENSMTRLNFKGKTRFLEFLDGEMSIGSDKGAVDYEISSKGGKVTVGQGSKATFSRDEDKLSIEVNQGSAAITKEDGTVQSVSTNQEYELDLKNGQGQLVQRAIVPLAPGRNARLLYLSQAAPQVQFAWQKSDAQADQGADGAYTLELSDTKEFQQITQSLPVHGEEANLSVATGTWYWRVRDSKGELSPTRRFSLSASAYPAQSLPEDGADFVFRKQKPDVAFSWTPMNEASAYTLELSKDKDFTNPSYRLRTALPRLNVPDLDAGTWYWRVTPVHGYEVLGQVAIASTRGFTVEKKPEMGPLTQSSPYDGSLYQIQEITGKGLAFSWLPDSDARDYEVAISQSRDFSKPLVSLHSERPYLMVSGQQIKALEKAGLYYWAVRWADKTKALSPWSQARALQGIDGSIAMRLSFPPDGYTIADSLASNTRFTWKSNVPARTEFQVATDQDFQNIVSKQTMQAETLMGKAWPVGQYYWRLRTYNTDGTPFIDTAPRGFAVCAPFDGPLLDIPTPGSRVILREADTQEISWKPVPRADYYNVKLSVEDGGVVYQASLYPKTSLTVPLGDLPQGNYTASVQAFGMDKIDSTRVIGYIGETKFTYKKLSYLKLEQPADKSRFPGLSQRRGGVRFSFSSKEQPDTATLIITSDAAGKKVLRQTAVNGLSVSVSKLEAGQYYWTYEGKTDGYNVSAKERWSFNIDPIPLLPAPSPISPAPGFSFGPNELKTQNYIDFSWKAVEGANRYRLRIYADQADAPVVDTGFTEETKYTLKQLDLLDHGDFRWEVEANFTAQDGTAEQDGKKAVTKFKIDLPSIKASTLKKGDFYGR
jgi:hypothetical protein